MWPSPSPQRGVLLLALIGGLGLRLALLDTFPLRADEALYGFWALHLDRVDPMALEVWPDKPPLFLWLLGGVFRIAGASEAAARLLNIWADTLTIGVVAATARIWWGPRAGAAAGLLYGLAPFAISFAPTAYTDPTLVLWGSLALWAVAGRRILWAGLFLGAALMTKQQGVLYAPLIGAVAVFGTEAGRRLLRPDTGAALLRAGGGLALVVGPVLVWDALRWQVAPSPWDLGTQNYAALAILPPARWLPQLQEWGGLLWYLTASDLAWSAVLLGTLAAPAATWLRKAFPPPLCEAERSGHSPAPECPSGRGYAGPRLPGLLLLWAISFMLGHAVTSIQVWDRYLLPLAPVLALLAGWGYGQIGPQPWQKVWGLVVGLALLPPALTAAGGGLPVGGDHGDHRGLTEVVTWLQDHAPGNAVLYHHALGWHYRFYFFDPAAPDAASLELRWYPHPIFLADRVARTVNRPQYVVQPDWAPIRHGEQRLAARGIRWRTRLRRGNFTLYELLPRPPSVCAWCVSSLPEPAWLDPSDPVNGGPACPAPRSPAQG